MSTLREYVLEKVHGYVRECAVEKLREYAQPYNICINVVDDVVIGTMHMDKDGKPYAHTGDIIPEDIIHEKDAEKVISFMDKLNKHLRRSLRISFRANNENELLQQLGD